MAGYIVDVCAAPRHDEIPEVDEDELVIITPKEVPPVKQLLRQFDLMSLLVSPRVRSPVPLVPKAVARARLSYIENRYGTRSKEPKKTSKQTFDRLSNPIHGFSSTLNALPQHIRKKRQQEQVPMPKVENPRRKIIANKETQSKLTQRLSKPSHVRPRLIVKEGNQTWSTLPPIKRPLPKTRTRVDKKKSEEGGGFFLTQIETTTAEPKRKKSFIKSNKVAPQQRERKKKTATRK